MGEKKKGMARKGKEIALQREVETQEDWEDMLSKEGLCVVDVYQGWCGLCSGMTSNFKKFRNDLNDDLLNFFAAKSDTIDALEKYRGRCEPCFLFFAGGVLVAVIRGANAPLILRTITEQLAQEHKVLDGQAERKEIKDTMIAKLEEAEKQREEEEAEEEGGAPKKKQAGEPKKEVSVAIIKPDAVQSGKAEEIMEEMKKRGIEILRQEERLLTDDEVKNLYIHLQDESYFDDLVAFMTSAPCIVLAITKGKTGENIIQEFRELVGPTEVDEAKEQAPESLRAKFGSEKYMNAVHGADSQDTAARELAFFFPDFVAPTVEGQPKLQRTLALIRPDAYKNNKDQILAKIRESGFKVAMQKEVHLNKEQAEEFYSEHQGQEYFDELTTRMSSGPLLALGLAREDAIDGWRHMLGPTLVEEAKEQQPDSLRAQFAEEGASINMLHGSDSEEKAQKEIEYFFPMEQTLAVIKPDAYGTKDDIINKIHEAGFRIAARKETTLSKEIAEEFYGDHKDKEYYNELVEHMCSGPTYFMVLSREGAVDGWRSLIGPTDPSQAKEVDPDTIRGTFGQDTLRNAVHGSSNKEHAMQNIERIFEDKEVFGLKDTNQAKEAVLEGTTDSGDKREPETKSEETPDVSVPNSEDSGAPVPSSEQSSAPAQQSEPDGDVVKTSPDVPDVVLHEVPSVDPEQIEEAIAEQQEISYETAPEQGGPDKPSSPKPDEKKEEDEGYQETTEQSDEQKAENTTEQDNEQTTEEPAQEQQQDQQPEQQQQEEEKPAEQEPEPVQQEQSEAQEVKQDEEAQPAPETQPEQEQQAEEKPSETQETTETTEPTQESEQEPEQKPAEGETEAPAEQTETKPEAEPEPDQKEEPKQEEEVQKEEPADKPEEATEEKKDETPAEQKEETKTDEQKPEGEEQQAA